MGLQGMDDKFLKVSVIGDEVRPSRWRGLWTSNPVTIEPEDCKAEALPDKSMLPPGKLWAQQHENQMLKEYKRV